MTAMTTNQTIDGVPRELLASFAAYVQDSPNAIMRARVKELRALLDAPACKRCNGSGWIDNLRQVGTQAMDCPDCKSAAQPQGEPWRTEASQFLSDAMTAAGMVRHGKQDKKFAERLADCCVRVRLAWLAEQPAPVAAVPDGYCIMPRQLTAENGAKALLLGEFKLLVTKECPECCELEEPVEGCSICDGEGEYGQKHTIPWDQIKFIYSKAVSGLAVNAESAKT